MLPYKGDYDEAGAECFMSAEGISCKKATPNGQGILHVDIGEVNGSPIIDVYFLAEVADDSDLNNYKNYEIVGGERITTVKILQAIRSNQNKKRVRLFVSAVGDFSNYTLCVHSKELDPFFVSKTFIFRPYCQAEFDCKKADLLDEEQVPEEPQTIDYMAKDYDSFRQALLDLVPSKAPGWLKLSEADFGVATIELFSYVADRLSYYQDRVSNEAFLETAKHRFSVKSHLNLIDYDLRNGMAANTFIHIKAKEEAVIQKGFPASSKSESEEEEEDDDAVIVFETDDDGYVSPILNNMRIFHGGNEDCILQKGSTSTLLLLEIPSAAASPLGSLLRNGDYLLFIEDLKREVVRLSKDAEEIKVPGVTTPGTAVVRVSWSESDRLSKDYFLSNGAECKGNIIPATHGKTRRPEFFKIYKGVGVSVTSFDSLVTDEDLQKTDHALLPINPNQPFLTLSNWPLTYLKKRRDTFASGDGTDTDTSVVVSFPQTIAKSSLRVWVDNELWSEAPSLLELGPFDKSYLVFVDEDGIATVIFGDGLNGKRPGEGSNIRVTYRTGTGIVGNIGFNVLTQFPSAFSDIVEVVTNPLPGQNGVDIESAEEAKMLAPKYIRIQQRAVTPKDYEVVAQEHNLVSRAKARFVWTGSWHTVVVSIDPREPSKVISRKERQQRLQTIKDEVERMLVMKKMAGYDIQVNPPDYVPLRLELIVCVNPDFFIMPVKDSVETALSDQINPDGSKGFFHPDYITFGQPIHVSDIYKAVMDVPGVLSVTIKNFKKMSDTDEKSKDYLDQGYLPVKDIEIARLDNDRNFPEMGILVLEMIGGKSGGNI